MSPLPVGTYPIGGPVIFTGEKPTATAELYAAGARWIGENGAEVIERSGSVGSYAYAWVAKGGSTTSTTSVRPTVEVQNADYAILATDENKVLVNQGNANHTFTLPAISSSVPVGWSIYLVNDSLNNDVTVRTTGADTIETGHAAPGPSQRVPPGAALELLVITTSHWIATADTALQRYAEDDVARDAAATAAEGAMEALSGVRTNSDRLNITERKTAGLDIVSDGPGLTTAPAAEAGIAIFAATSTVGAGLTDGSRNLQSSDIASYSWQQTVALGATEQATIVRVEGTKGPIDYYLEHGAESTQLQSYRKILSDSAWDYYYVGNFANMRLTIQKRAELTHTRFHDELAGDALQQVGDLLDEHRPDPSITVDPPAWAHDTLARTFLITIHDLRPSNALATVDKVRLFIEGSPIATLNWTYASGARVLAFPVEAAAALTNITNNTSIDDTVYFQLGFHATAGGNPVDANSVLTLNTGVPVLARADVPTPGASSTLVEHPRVFHANAIAAPDPDDASIQQIHFQPNEHGLKPLPNSLFTFVWALAPNLTINRFTMSPHGTPHADATTVGFSDRDGQAGFNNSSRLKRNTTYLARFSGSAITILTALNDTDAAAFLSLIKSPRQPTDRGKFITVSPTDENMLALSNPPDPGVVSTAPGAAFETTLIGSGNFDATTALRYATQVNSADITIPAAGEWAIVSFGGPTATTNATGNWHIINLTTLRAAVANYGENPQSVTNKGLIFTDAIATGQDAYLGVTSARKLLFASSGPTDAIPLTIRLITPAAVANNLLIDNPAMPVLADATNRDKVLYRAGRLYKNEPLHYADPTATYRDFAGSDLPTGYSWGGAVQVSPSPTGRSDNNVIYSIPGGHALRKITGGGRAWWVNYTLPNWQGAVANESAADQIVGKVGDVVFFNGKVQVVATYTPRTPDQFHWVPIEKQRFEQTVGASPATLPFGSHTIHYLLTSAGHTFPQSVKLSQLAETSKTLFADTKNVTVSQADRPADVAATMSYNATTRILTYAGESSHDALSDIVVEGEA